MFDFSGRSRRSEYWWFVLFAVILIVPAALIEAFVLEDFYYGVFGDYVESSSGLKAWIDQWVYIPVTMTLSYATMIPIMSLQMRRLHDVGFSGWPVVLAVVMNEAAVIIPFEPEFQTVFNQGGNVQFWVLGALFVVLLLFEVFIFITTLRDSKKASNRFGPSPKYGSIEGTFD